MADKGTILALDVGEVRIGVALASPAAKLAAPYATLTRHDGTSKELAAICSKERVTQLVVGLPRGMNGQSTQQTARVEEFGELISHDLSLPVAWQDEAVTSIRAANELVARGKPYVKGDIDALAATYILEDYLHENL